MKKSAAAYPVQTIEDDYGRYEQDAFGDWIGWTDERRTLLKFTLVGAKEDIRNERFVCKCWPKCKHKGPA